MDAKADLEKAVKVVVDSKTNYCLALRDLYESLKGLAKARNRSKLHHKWKKKRTFGIIYHIIQSISHISTYIMHIFIDAK